MSEERCQESTASSGDGVDEEGEKDMMAFCFGRESEIKA